MEGYEVYQTYLALKLHFTKENYNFFIFSGKTRASKQSFEKRKDKYFFKKLGRKFEREELINFFVSHFIHDDGAWIGNISVYKSKGAQPVGLFIPNAATGSTIPVSVPAILAVYPLIK